MRLKAEMQNYRSRQRRWAEDEVVREKSRLLHRFLDVVDSLEQSLSYLDSGDPVHQGVQLAYDGILALLLREGVERIFAQGRAFDRSKSIREPGSVGDSSSTTAWVWSLARPLKSGMTS